MFTNSAFCDNVECNVITFVISEGINPTNNCPGCGEFGRVKGQIPKQRD